MRALEIQMLFRPVTGLTCLCSAENEILPGGFQLDRIKLWDLDIRDTAVLKCLAISAIVLHNFFHAVSPAHQNEFTFNPARFPLFLETVRQPALAIQAFFSFFGHFGVQIFIFLSAYGLAKSHWDDPAGWTEFMTGRIRKLYPTFGLVVLPWVAIVSLQSGPLTVIRNMGLQLGLMFVGLSPFLPGHGLPPVGPWWFIPFIIQFYAIWPLLRKLTGKFGWPGLLVFSALCLTIAVAADPVLSRWSVNLFETPIGRMPVICFGIAAARFPIRIGFSLVLAACVTLLLGSLYFAVWPFTFLAALMVALWSYAQMRGALRQTGFLERISQYSILIFLENGIVRDQFIPFATSPCRQLVFGCISAAVSFAVAVLIREFVQFLAAGNRAHGGASRIGNGYSGQLIVFGARLGGAAAPAIIAPREPPHSNRSSVRRVSSLASCAPQTQPGTHPRAGRAGRSQ